MNVVCVHFPLPIPQFPVGTYLLRTRLGAAGDSLGHAISLRTQEDTKHMKVGHESPCI